MLFKNISLRIDPLKFADDLVHRVDASAPNSNRIVVVEYVQDDVKGDARRFIKTLGYLEMVLRKFPEISVKTTIYSTTAPKVHIHLPEAVSEQQFFAELNAYFRSQHVQADVGKSAVRLNDMRGYDSQLKAAIHSRIKDLESMIDDHEIEETHSRRINEEEKRCLRMAFRYVGSYFLVGRELRGDFHVLISGLKEMLKANQGLASILAFIILELKLSKKEAEEFLSQDYTETNFSHISDEVLKLVEVSNELYGIDEHLLVSDMAASEKANKLKSYIIWKSYEIAKRRMRRRMRKLDEEQAQLMAYRALVVDMSRRLGLAKNMNLIEDRAERSALARRIYFVDALVARDLNLEELHYNQREEVFLTSYPEEARIIGEEVKKRFSGKTALEMLSMMKELREFFEDDFIKSVLGQLHNSIEEFLTSEGKAPTVERYWPVIQSFAREILTGEVLHGSREFSEKNAAFTRELFSLRGLEVKQVSKLFGIVNSFLLDRQIPRVEMRLKTLHSIYEKIRRLKYERMERAHKEAQRKMQRIGAIYADFEVSLDDVVLEPEEIREYIRFVVPAGLDRQRVFMDTKDEKVHDVVACRIIVESPEDRLTVLSWLDGYGEVLESKTINKPSGYRAVHVKLWENVFFEEVIEVQIRDKEAHKQAEYGDAHHRFWKGAERVPALSPFHTFRMFLGRMGDVKFIPVEVYHHTRAGKEESVGRDFVILQEGDNKYDLLVQGGYYRQCINLGKVKASGERVTRVNLKSGFYRAYSEKLAASVNSLRSSLKVKITMAQGSSMADFRERMERMKTEYKPFEDRLRALARELNLEDLDMVYGGLVVDANFGKEVNRRLEIEQKVEMKRLWVVVGDEKERYIRVKINIPNRVGMIHYWADMLRQMGFSDVEEFSSSVKSNDTSDLVFVFRGDLSDDISNSMREALNRATAYYHGTSEKPMAFKPMNMNITIRNNVRSISQLGKFFTDRGINVINLEPVSERSRKNSKNRTSLSFSMNIAIPSGQVNKINEMISDLSMLSFMEKVDVEEK